MRKRKLLLLQTGPQSWRIYKLDWKGHYHEAGGIHKLGPRAYSWRTYGLRFGGSGRNTTLHKAMVRAFNTLRG